MSRLRYFPLDVNKLARLREIAEEIHRLRHGVPINGQDRAALQKVLDALDLISWRIAGQPLLTPTRAPAGNAGASELTTPIKLVRIEEAGEIRYGSYRRLGDFDSLMVESPEGWTVARTRGKPEHEVAERELRRIVVNRLAAEAQGWRRL